MERSLFHFIMKYSLPQQIILVVLAIFAQVFIFLGLDLPKTILDDVIQGDASDFPVKFLGVELDQIQYLMLLCMTLLGIFLINQGFKYIINIYRGITAERMLRRLRYILYDHVLRFPPGHFKTTSQGEIIPIITAETEPVGGFVGDAISLPVFQGGTLITILIFLFIQSPLLAIAATSLYPIQIYLIPVLQKRVNTLAKQRIRLVRGLSDHLGETVAMIEQIHTNHTTQYERSRFSDQLGKIFNVRYQIYLWKFIIKFINNFINQLGPFTFYSIGGYLVITGNLSIGALIAGIAAHKDIAAPWKELLGYYQRLSDARIKYEQIINQFQPAGMIPAQEQTQNQTLSDAPNFEYHIKLDNISSEDETNVAVLSRVTATIPLDKSIAIIGDVSVSGSELARVIAGLAIPTRGQVLIDDKNLQDIPETIRGHRIGYVGPHVALGSGTLGDVLFYPLKQSLQEDLSQPASTWAAYIREAEKSGNSPAPFDGQWIDNCRLGWASDQDMVQQVHNVLSVTHMLEDIFELGLNGIIDPDQHPDVVTAVLTARQILHTRLSETNQNNFVESFEPTSYLSNATVSENLIFGHYIGGDLTQLTHHPFTAWVLERVGLTRRMLDLGYQVAEIIVKAYTENQNENLLQEYGFSRAEDISEYEAILDRNIRTRLTELKGDDRRRILALPFQLVPARHRLGLMTPFIRNRVVTARQIFNDNIPLELKDKIDFFQPDRFTKGGTILDNILFGRIANDQPNAQKAVLSMVRDIGHERGLFNTLVDAGMAYNVGVGTSKLNSLQRQKLAISRTLLKDPDLLILDNALSGLSGPEIRIILANIQKAHLNKGLIVVLSQPELALQFDHALVIKQGSIVENAPVTDLKTKENSFFNELLKSDLP